MSDRSAEAPVYLVSHFHWDREWYRTMQGFRARLVDAIDTVLDLAEADPDYRFLLDGQTVVLEDYLEVRPEREESLRRHVESGRLGIGPWYVQPDSLLPSGEAHVRNLLLGRDTGARFGRVQAVAYVPDSFGHPAQFPELFCGFGLDGFVYWRGNGNEVERLGARWCWRAPSGASVRALLLTQGYFSAARMDPDVDRAVERLEGMVARLRDGGERPLVLMNGFDHTGPDPHTREVASALGRRLGSAVVRSLLDDVVDAAPPCEGLPDYRGDLIGGKLANLLQGVWSARLPLKIRNRRIETLLQSWAEPWAALGCVLGLHDERPALNQAWRSLVQNQAHDSICGCSTDATHARMEARYDDAEGLAAQTTARVLERLAGRGAARTVPWTGSQRVTVFNPSPHPRTERVRVGMDGNPGLTLSVGEPALHPLMLAAAGATGYRVDGRDARIVDSSDPTRVKWMPGQRAVDVEFVAEDVPAFGCRTYAVEPAPAAPDRVDDGRVISAGEVSTEVAGDGTVIAGFGGRRFPGLLALEDVGDRGDSYDHDPVGVADSPDLVDLQVERRRHVSGLQSLHVRRTLEVPASLDGSREVRRAERARLELTSELSVAPGVSRIDVRLTLRNRARDHRLRLLFPFPTAVDRYRYATTFDVASGPPEPVDATGWMHPAPTTFCHQGWVAAQGLGIVAPGLPEAAVTPEGALALTLVRSVGWLARMDLRSRALPAGPVMEAAGAQVPGEVSVDLSLVPDLDSRAARDACAGLWGVLAGPAPLLSPGTALVSVSGDDVVLSALKPAAHGEGLVLRLQNPTESSAAATVRFGFGVSSVTPVRLDETPATADVGWDGEVARVAVPAHGLLSLRVTARAQGGGSGGV